MKPNRRGTADLLTQTGAAAQNVPDYVVAGLARLATDPPALWPIDQLARWPAVVDQVTAFASRWDGRARAAGWNDLSLYGLHRDAPYASVAGMGAAFLVALTRSTVHTVRSDAIAIVSPTGSRLRIYRRSPDPAAVLAWELAWSGQPTCAPVDKSR